MRRWRGEWPVVLGIVMMVAVPIMYGVMGFIGGIITAVVYNAAAGMIGGVKFELEGVQQEYAPPPPPHIGRRSVSRAVRRSCQIAADNELEVEVERILPGGMGWPMPAGRLFLFHLPRPAIAFGCGSIASKAISCLPRSKSPHTFACENRATVSLLRSLRWLRLSTTDIRSTTCCEG